MYQEAKTEGIQEGIQKGTTNAIVKIAAKNMPAEEIAAILEVDVQLVRQTLTHLNGD